MSALTLVSSGGEVKMYQPRSQVFVDGEYKNANLVEAVIYFLCILKISVGEFRNQIIPVNSIQPGCRGEAEYSNPPPPSKKKPQEAQRATYRAPKYNVPTF